MKTKIILGILLFCVSGLAAQTTDWSGVEKVFGRKGSVQDNVFRIAFPRTDLQVKIGDVTVAPGLALGSWIGFMKMGDQAMIMGDLVLLDKEVSPVMSKLISENIQITALHNHLIGESPTIKYMHFGASGDPVQLAEKMKAALALTGTPMAAGPPSQAAAPDWSKVIAILGPRGKPNGSLLQYGFPRKEELTEGGMSVPPSMGMATGINFQMVGNKAAITGDFVLLADEVNPVVKTLIENGITVTAIHNHMLHDNPRLFMVHYWAVDDPVKLAQGLKAALEKTNSKY